MTPDTRTTENPDEQPWHTHGGLDYAFPNDGTCTVCAEAAQGAAPPTYTVIERLSRPGNRANLDPEGAAPRWQRPDGSYSCHAPGQHPPDEGAAPRAEGLPTATDLDVASDLLFKVALGKSLGPTSRELAKRLAHRLSGQQAPDMNTPAAPRAEGQCSTWGYYTGRQCSEPEGHDGRHITEPAVGRYSAAQGAAPRPDYSDPSVTVDQLLAEGWRPDGHRNVPHALDEDECWCNESRSEGAAPRAEGPLFAPDSEHCHECGQSVGLVWTAPDDLWAAVTGITTGGGIRCIPCFDKAAEAQGRFIRWVPQEEPRSALRESRDTPEQRRIRNAPEHSEEGWSR